MPASLTSRAGVANSLDISVRKRGAKRRLCAWRVIANCHTDINPRVHAIMPAVTIRNLSDETHRALKLRAARHNRSTEAEMRAILEASVRPEGRLRLGSALAEISRTIGLTNADVEALEQASDATPAEPLRFE
jgi:plasmid stability protein